MRIFDLSTRAVVSSVLNVANVVHDADAGLLDIATDPQLATNGRIYSA